MKVSFIVATIGRSTDVGRLFDSLSNQFSSDFEVIVIDQNTDDRLLPFIEVGRKKGIEILHERLEKPNLSGARNRGIVLARHDIIAFPDDDCWYDPQLIEVVISTFLNGQHIDCLVGKWVEQAGRKDILPHFMTRESWRCFRGGDASSISLFIRKKLLVSLNGFDERLGVGRWYGAAEETDLLLRALDCGASIFYCPTAKVHHHFLSKPSGELKAVCRNARQRARGTGALYAKHKLSLDIILRGILGPILMSIQKLRTPVELLRGIYISLGRIEGYLRWRYCEKKR